jgi:RNA polymerase sigma factor (sigma-70 family)
MPSEEDFASFFLIHRSNLVRAISWASGDPHLAEDVAQETMMIVRRTWGRYERPDLAMYQIGRRLARRLATRNAAAVPIQATEWESLANAAAPTPSSSEPDASAEVREALRALPTRQREVLVLVFVCDLRLDEIANVLGITESAVKTHKARGMARLNELLAHLSPGAAGTTLPSEEGVL